MVAFTVAIHLAGVVLEVLVSREFDEVRVSLAAGRVRVTVCGTGRDS
jgi:hypothetical protein